MISAMADSYFIIVGLSFILGLFLFPKMEGCVETDKRDFVAAAFFAILWPAVVAFVLFVMWHLWRTNDDST